LIPNPFVQSLVFWVYVTPYNVALKGKTSAPKKSDDGPKKPKGMLLEKVALKKVGI